MCGSNKGDLLGYLTRNMPKYRLNRMCIALWEMHYRSFDMFCVRSTKIIIRQFVRGYMSDRDLFWWNRVPSVYSELRCMQWWQYVWYVLNWMVFAQFSLFQPMSQLDISRIYGLHIMRKYLRDVHSCNRLRNLSYWRLSAQFFLCQSMPRFNISRRWHTCMRIMPDQLPDLRECVELPNLSYWTFYE